MGVNEPTQEQTVIEIDGYLVNELGEVVGMTSQPKPEFHVEDAESADWVLKKICDAESEAARIQLVLASVKERLETEVKAQLRRAEYLKYRFGGELEHFAKENLPSGKKTWKGVWGEVSFRTTKPRLDIVDEARAIEWAKSSSDCATAVKVTEKLNKSELPIETVELLLNDPESAAVAGFDVIPASESMTIKTVKA